MSPRTGRPKVENPKSYSIKIRFDEETYTRLADYCQKHNLLRTDAIRQGIEMLLSQEK